MKIAIIGAGPRGLLAAAHFKALGAQVDIFSQSSELGGGFYALFKGNSPEAKTRAEEKLKWSWSELIPGKDSCLYPFIDESLDPSYHPNYREYWDQFLGPLVKKLQLASHAHCARVVRVQKQFLAPDDDIEGHSRLLDLFKVVYQKETAELVGAEREENPDLYKSLDPKLVDSLKEPLEQFGLFDLVIDATGPGKIPMPLGAGQGPALNEARALSLGLIKNAREVLFKQKSNKQDDEDKTKNKRESILIIGQKYSKDLIQHFLPRLVSGKIQVTFIDSGLEVETATPKEIKKYNQMAEDQYQQEKQGWEKLESYEKVKMKAPTKAVNPLQILQHALPTSVDILEDLKGVFLTIEVPPWVKDIPLKTLKADYIINARPEKRRDFSFMETCRVGSLNKSEGPSDKGMPLHPEPGLYSLGMREGGGEDFSQDILEELKAVEKNILTYFGRKN